MMRFLVFLLLLCCQGSFAAFSSNWYTEDAFLDRENILSSLLRVRGEYSVTSFLSPYLTVGSELQTPSQSFSNVATSSYAYGGPGFKLDLFSAQLYSELRGRGYYREMPNQKQIDARILLVLSDYGDAAMDASRSLLSFYEFYSETLFTTADENNLIESAYIRAGLRKPLIKELMLDLFVEPFASVDRIGHFYNNRADMKLNLRLLYATPSLTFGFTGSYLANQYFNFAKFDRNPYENETAGFRVLFVAGGTF